MEGVIQYRLLGSHPAASGRYLTLGFTGETTILGKVLEQLIREHQINTARYKLDVVRLVNNTSNASSVPGVPSEQPLHNEDRIYTYDRLAITISQRQLSDELKRAAAAAQAEEARRLRETERQLVGDRSSTVLERNTLTSSISGSNRRDPHELERVAVVASRVFPVRSGQRCQETTRDAASGAERRACCVLCDLVAFDPVRTPCCHFLVCRLCLQSARAIVADTNERCPVCGRVLVSSQPSNDDEGVVMEECSEGGLKSDANGRTGGAMQEVKSFVIAEGLVVQDAKSTPGSAGRPRLGVKTRREEKTPATSSARLTPEMMTCERNLVERLDQILAMLDVPDPLSSEVKAHRVRSAALKALDDHS